MRTNHDSDREKNDRGLLIGVVAFVVTGAAGIALLAALASRDGEQPSGPAAAARGVTGRPAPTETLPAVWAPDRMPEPVSLDIDEPVAAVPPGEGLATCEHDDPLGRGLELFRAGEHAAAAACFAEADSRHPDRGFTVYMLGLAEWKAGRLDAAAGTLARAAEIDASAVRPRVNLARVQNERGDFEAALDASRAALAIAPEDASALFLEGRALRNLGQREQALVALERSVALAPGNGYAHNLLGLTWLELERVDEALAAFEVAAERIPDVAYVHNNLGMALERSGAREEAVAAYRRAVALDPAHAAAGRNLARLAPAGTAPRASEGDAVAVAAGG